MKKLLLCGADEAGNFDLINKHFSGKSVSVVYLEAVDLLFEVLSAEKFDLVALSDFNGKISDEILKLSKIVNIHPSLLPSFEGENAIANAYQSGVKVSGVTINEVDNSSSVKIIAQLPIMIENLMHFDEFRSDVYELQNNLYPIVIESILEDRVFDYQDFFKKNVSCGGCKSESSGTGSCGCGGCGNH